MSIKIYANLTSNYICHSVEASQISMDKLLDMPSSSKTINKITQGKKKNYPNYIKYRLTCRMNKHVWCQPYCVLCNELVKIKNKHEFLKDFLFYFFIN